MKAKGAVKGAVVLLQLVSLLAMSAGLTGCTRGGSRLGRWASPEPCLAAGRLVRESRDLDEGIVTYWIEGFQAAGSAWTNKPGWVVVDYYLATGVSALPTNALLILTPGDADHCASLRRDYANPIPAAVRAAPPLDFELLGSDFSRSLFIDTAENRERLARLIAAKRVYPPRREWLPKEEAIRLALESMLEYPNPSANILAAAKATRYAFGWVVTWLPPSWHGMGAPAEVVVRDDRTIVYTRLALY